MDVGLKEEPGRENEIKRKKKKTKRREMKKPPLNRNLDTL